MPSRLKDRVAYNAYMKDYMRRRYHRRRLEWIVKLGGRCVKCGCNNHDALEFHHRDKSLKAFDIADKISKWTDARLAEEMAKCELRCAECHKEQHAVDNPHGTARKFDQGCRCDACRQACRDRHHEWCYRTGRREKPVCESNDSTHALSALS